MRPIISYVIPIVVLAVLSVAFIGCAGTPAPDATAPIQKEAQDPAMQGQPVQQPIVIGVSASMTGPAALYGESFVAGLAKAAEEINAAGTKIEYVVEDNKNDGKEGVSAYQRLLLQNPDIIITQGSSPSVSIAPLVQEHGTPLFGSLTTAPFQKDYRNSFNFYLSARDNAAALVPFFRERNVTRVALYYVNGENGRNGIVPVKERLEAEGFDIVAEETYLPTDTDHETAMLKIAQAKPQAVYVWATRPDQVVGAAKKDLKSMIVFSELPVTLGQYRDSGDFDGVYGLGMAYTVPGSPQNAAFNAKFGDNANGYTAFGYDLLMLINRETAEGGADSVVDNVIASRSYDGLVGNVSTDRDDRQISIPLTVLKIENRTLVRP